MMENTNIIFLEQNDESFILMIGTFIKQQRLLQNRTQLETATAAGIHRWTLNQLEKGESINLTSFIQILRALNLLMMLENFTPTNEISPIALAKLEQEKRQRASPVKPTSKKQSKW